MDMPDYFLALNKQYGLALNDQQAITHIRAITEAWYFSISQKKQTQLVENLPGYLVPHRKILFNKNNPAINSDQSAVVIERLSMQLQKTDQAEVVQIIGGFFRALKVILSNEQKFRLSELLTGQLKNLFIQA